MSSNEFGAYLKQLRKAKGLTVRELSNNSGVAQSYITNIENFERGVPSVEIIRKLSTALSVTFIGMMIKAGYITLEEVLTERKEHGIYD